MKVQRHTFWFSRTGCFWLRLMPDEMTDTEQALLQRSSTPNNFLAPVGLVGWRNGII